MGEEEFGTTVITLLSTPSLPQHGLLTVIRPLCVLQVLAYLHPEDSLDAYDPAYLKLLSVFRTPDQLDALLRC